MPPGSILPSFSPSFLASLDDERPAAELGVELRALWHDANGNAELAHRAAHANGGHACLRIRAYLARKAGDERDARIKYWRAGAKPWEGSLESEWADIAQSVFVELHVANAYQ